MRVTIYQLGLLLALAPPLGAAGIVQTADARLEGDMAWADGCVVVSGKAVPWDSVVYVLPLGQAAAPAGAGAVRWADGEVWRADIARLSGGKLSVRSALLGTQEIEARQVAAVEFVPGAAAPGGAAAGALYRDKGEPIPGTLLWIDETRLAIDSPLGVLTLPREGALGYVFPAGPKSAAGGPDEVGLADGSILRGTLRPTAKGLDLRHTVLGTVNIDAAQVRFVTRYGARATDLTRLAPASVTATGLLGKMPAEAAVTCRRAGDAGWAGGRALAVMTLQPKTVVAFKLPQAGAGARLVARIAPADGARGDVHVRIAAGGTVVFEEDLAPGAKPMPVVADLPQAARLTIEVDFGRRLGFPCGACIEDPLLISRG
ncbi:MAG: hypothetical protein IMZ44_20615 [Planctomycetes bacterium]|nr:hypothetical protein [Planctomycetota bacterium]